ELIASGAIESAHEISEGGLFVTRCESGFKNDLGFTVLTNDDLRKDAFLFGEAQSRVVVSVAPTKFELFESIIKGFPHQEVGIVSTGKIEIDGEDWGEIRDWKNLYDRSIEKHLTKELEGEGALGML
ncbi:MAG: AIR synthase-related protein, partial [Flavisolibacter sp.]